MRFRIDDPANGLIKLRSTGLVSVWRKFRENGTRTPLARRDPLLKPGSALTVRIDCSRASGVSGLRAVAEATGAGLWEGGESDGAIP